MPYGHSKIHQIDLFQNLIIKPQKLSKQLVMCLNNGNGWKLSWSHDGSGELSEDEKTSMEEEISYSDLNFRFNELRFIGAAWGDPDFDIDICLADNSPKRNVLATYNIKLDGGFPAHGVTWMHDVVFENPGNDYSQEAGENDGFTTGLRLSNHTARHP